MKVAALVILVVPLGFLGWTPSPEGLVRNGNAAFARGEYARALELFSQAEGQTTDPGLVAFNKAAALYQFGRFREAELHYRRCREDASGTRLARLLYGLGNCLVQQGATGDAGQLDQAIRSYEECLTLGDADDDLKTDARHNLEVAKQLRSQRPPGGQQSNPPDDSPKSQQERPDGRSPDGQTGEDEPNGKSPFAKGKAVSLPAEKRRPGTKATPVDQSPPPGKGNLPPVPDQDELARLSPEDAREHLRQSALRIAQELREHRRRSLLAPARRIPDW